MNGFRSAFADFIERNRNTDGEIKWTDANLRSVTVSYNLGRLTKDGPVIYFFGFSFAGPAGGAAGFAAGAGVAPGFEVGVGAATGFSAGLGAAGFDAVAGAGEGLDVSSDFLPFETL